MESNRQPKRVFDIITISKKALRNGLRSLGFIVLFAMLSGFFLGQFARPPLLKMLIPVAIFAMLYPMMLNMRLEEILRTIYCKRRLLLLALTVNLAACPLLITLVGQFTDFKNNPSVAIGLTLYASVPCGGMVPAFTGILGGNIILAITILVTSLLMSILTVPLWTKLLIGHFVQFPIPMLIEYLSFLILLPMVLANLTRIILIAHHRSREEYINFEVHMRRIAGYGLALLCFIVFVFNGHIILDNPGLIVGIILPATLFLTTLLAGASAFFRYTRLNESDAIAVTIGIAAKNNALSLALAVSIFDSEVAIVNAIAGPMVQLPIMITFLIIRKNAGRILKRSKFNEMKD